MATSAAGLFGGPPNTTYAEVTGAVMLTKNYNPKIMTWAAVVFTPIMLAYTAWTYWVFRRRLSVEHLPARPAVDAGAR